MNRLKFCTTLVVLAAACSMLAGCSPTTSGTPEPTPSPGAGSGSKSPTATQGVFGDLKACDLLDKGMESRGFTPSKPDQAGGPNSCFSEKSGYGEVSLSLHSGLGIKDFPALDQSKIFDGDLNGRPAAEIHDGVRAEGDCMIAMAVGEKNRAIVNGALNTGTTAEACDFAKSIAKKIEPSLPKGN
ncbi:DUF3558 family protein [Amycolatopsis sp. NPDC059657]|uniref:DUF3558 family protein n=1 Tax=Amycolatopsis sp. NPDC059657 TaxID=3346899 RepID=UPI00366AF4A4